MYIAIGQARIERWIEKKGHVWNCCIISGQYGKDLAVYDELFAEVKKDFPLLKRGDAACLQAGGIRVRNCPMLHFQIPDGSSVPDGWNLSENVEELRR